LWIKALSLLYPLSDPKKNKKGNMNLQQNERVNEIS